MSCKVFSYLLSVLLIAQVPINGISAGTDDNLIDNVPEYYLMQGVKVYPGDRECALVGGLCVHTSDCLEPTTNRGLCPSNTHRGVECCYELPLRPAPCEQHLGICMDRCAEVLQRPGTDCQGGQVCCVLI
ncbi:U-scoloptoxin(19)-Tl1a [Anastrepha obliqua]|uniref:U-scoloptoxin(19)-Tl1a n=1 Tax=Anastrepha obliqua TaxID=95512 RepID=UPI00240A3299|nr:U-scoloptoxin(19)-Tl1a [Anastrepha obliqua]